MGIAMQKLVQAGTLKAKPLKDFVCAISVGVVEGEPLLDLCYEEDSRADVDMNLVMTGSSRFVEVQASAERQAFDDAQLQTMIGLARKGLDSLLVKQKAILGELNPGRAE